jgi:hypothetical protein
MCISNFPTVKSLGLSVSSRYEEVDRIGTSLWNLCTRLRRNYDNIPQPAILLVTRAFAFLLLDCALESGNGTTANVIRLMKIGIKASKNCISMVLHTSEEVVKSDDIPANVFLECALKVLEKVGGYELMLKKPDDTALPGDTEVYKRLIAEYYILRTSLVS